MSANLDIKTRLVYLSDIKSLKININRVASFILVVPYDKISEIEEIKTLNNQLNYQILLSYNNKNHESLFKSYFINKKISFLFPSNLDNKYESFVETYNQLLSSDSMNSFLESNLNHPSNFKIISQFNLKHSDDRWVCYKEIRSFTETLPCFSNFSSIIDVIASELITNSFYDAYRDPLTNLSMHPDRRVSFMLPEKHQVEVKVATDDSFFWFYIKDTFGTLDKNTLFKALHRAASEKQVNLNSPGGAGIGLYMVFLWSSELYFYFNKNVSTEVLCKIKLTKRNQEFDESCPFLTVIEKNN